MHSKILLLLLFATVGALQVACTSEPQETQNAKSCTIAKDEAGQTLLKCPDGTSSVVHTSENACRLVANEEGKHVMVCAEGEETPVSLCSITQDKNGQTHIECTDGTTADVCKMEGRQVTCGEGVLVVPAGCAVRQYDFFTYSAYTLSCAPQADQVLMFAMKKLEVGTKQITTGNTHTCGLKTDGTALCWGENWGTLIQPPSGVFTSISAGARFTCGLRTDGAAECWGSDSSGQSTPPASTYFVQLSSGGAHTCGLQANLTAVCWGANSSGERNVPINEQFVQIETGNSHSCGLRADGSAVCWGENGDGQRDIPPNQRFIQLAAGSEHTCGLRPNGTALCWGQQNAPADPFTQISSGTGGTTCGIKANGTVSCWGGLSSPEGQFKQVSPTYNFACAIRADNSAVCWGYNSDGQTTIPPEF